MIHALNRSQLVYAATCKFTAAKRSGRVPTHVGLFCDDCNKPAEGYDHRDYRFPLDVVPICLACNSARPPGLPLPDGDKQLYEIDWYQPKGAIQ